MQYLKSPQNFMEYNINTLQEVRMLFDLDKPGRIKEAVKILEEWIKKQGHFVQKDFSEDFLERLIIANKGRLEKVKITMDKNFTMKNLLAEYFVACNVKEEFKSLEKIHDAVLPKLTPENYRIYLVNHFSDKMTSSMYTDYYKRCISIWHLVQRYEYCAGYIAIADFRDANLLDVVTNISLNELRAITTLWLEGFSIVVKGIHILSSSKMIDMLISIMKQVMKPKIAKRIHLHSSIQSLYTFIPKDILPKEYGGKENTLPELHAQLLDLLSTADQKEYMRTIKDMKTDESKRSVEKFNEEYLGTPGTFRTLVVD